MQEEQVVEFLQLIKHVYKDDPKLDEPLMDGDSRITPRGMLIKQRNILVDKPFFLFRPKLRAQVARIDKELALLDCI